MKKFVTSIILNILSAIATGFSLYFTISAAILPKDEALGLIILIPFILIASGVALVINLFNLIPTIKLCKSDEHKTKGKVMLAITITILCLAVLSAITMYLLLKIKFQAQWY